MKCESLIHIIYNHTNIKVEIVCKKCSQEKQPFCAGELRLLFSKLI